MDTIVDCSAALVGSDPRLNSYLPGGLDRQPAPGNGDIGQSHALLPEPHTFSDTVGTVLAPAGVAAIDTNHPRNDLPESHVNPPSHKNTSLPGFHRGRPESAGGNLPGSFTAGCGRESQHGRERVAGHPPAPKRPRLARGQQDDNQSGELSEHSDAIKDCRGKSQVGRNHIDPSVSSRDAGTSLDGLREPSLDTDQFTPDLVDIDAQRYEFRLLAITGSAGSTENTRSADWMAEVDENLDRTNAEQNTEAFTNDLPNPASIGEPPDSQSPLDSNGHSPVVTDIQIVACDNANVTNAYTPIRYHPSAVNHFSNPRPQLQLPIESRVPDTAQSIWLAMKGNIDGLKYMFSQRLASPRDVSSTRGFSLLDVCFTTPFITKI